MKKPISEIFDDMSNRSAKCIGSYGIKTEVDDMTKQMIYNSVMAEIESDRANKNNCRRKLKKVSVAAAACISALLIGTVGVSASKLYKGFVDYHQSYTEFQKKQVEKATFNIGKQTGLKGVTITATKGMCDGNKFFLLTELEVDTEIHKISDNDAISTSAELHMSGDPSDTNGYSSIYNELLEKNGNVFTILSVFDMGDVSDNAQIGISYSGLFNKTKNAEILSTEDGRAGVSFAIAKNRFAKSFDGSSEIKFASYNANVTDGYIAPWYASFYIDAFGENASLIENVCEDKPDVKITMKDGTIYTDKNGINVVNYNQAGSGNDSEGYHKYWEIICTFGDYIETSEINCLEINGVQMNLGEIEPVNALGY